MKAPESASVGAVRPPPSATDATANPAPADPGERVIQVARQIILETGDFDFSMRDLAARARVSLTTPYRHFGSKGGIVIAILRSDQAEYGQSLPPVADDEFGHRVFDDLQRGMIFYKRRQPFYRALFKAAYSLNDGSVGNPAREVLPGLFRWCRRAQRVGLLRPELDPQMAGEALTGVFSSEIHLWAHSAFDLELAQLRCAYGYALALAGLGAEPFAAEMRARVESTQRLIAEYHARHPA